MADFVTRAFSQLIYDDLLGRFLFAMRTLDLSLVTLSKSTNCTLIHVWVGFFHFLVAEERPGILASFPIKKRSLSE